MTLLQCFLIGAPILAIGSVLMKRVPISSWWWAPVFLFFGTGFCLVGLSVIRFIDPYILGLTFPQKSH